MANKFMHSLVVINSEMSHNFELISNHNDENTMLNFSFYAQN